MSDKRYKIIYEDEALIVIDKPSGMLTIPTPKKESNTLSSLINRELDERGIGINAYPCHRLDRDTSGLIIYAKGKSMQGVMMEEFRTRNVKKVYTAFVQGALKNDSDTIRIDIYDRNKRREEMAVTKYRVVARKKGFTVVEVEPVTGRTNQIRIHFKEIGHPLVGERIYAFRRDFELKFRRTALHAGFISFLHPVTKERMQFISPLPADMDKLSRSK
ncbi:MAG: RluA family pseudouridine synthase [Candidatus Omnitrophota bacterium]|jgi:23S rRNA pseudouridine1911/1915/1917 synthase